MPPIMYDLSYFCLFCLPIGVLLAFVFVGKVRLLRLVLVVLCASFLLEWMLALFGQRVIRLDVVAFMVGFTLLGFFAGYFPRLFSSR